MTTKVVLRGNYDLSKRAIPDSWLGRNFILHTDQYNITENDLSKIKKRLDQEKYWSKNPDRNGLIQYSFDDLFVEKDWVMWGQRRGKNGEFWNSYKLDLLQREIEDKVIVPENFVSMKDIKRYFGSKATMEKVEDAGYEVRYGKKKGKQGRCGYFVEPDILNDPHSVSVSDGAIPVGHLFSLFPKVGEEDLPEIVKRNKEDLMKKRVRCGLSATRKDLMVSEDVLEDMDRHGVQETKKLRSREVTSLDVVNTAAKLRKDIRGAQK